MLTHSKNQNTKMPKLNKIVKQSLTQIRWVNCSNTHPQWRVRQCEGLREFEVVSGRTRLLSPIEQKHNHLTFKKHPNKWKELPWGSPQSLLAWKEEEEEKLEVVAQAASILASWCSTGQKSHSPILFSFGGKPRLGCPLSSRNRRPTHLWKWSFLCRKKRGN